MAETTNGDIPHGPNIDGVDLPFHTNVKGYHVPDVTYKSPGNQRMRVVTIGAGYSGILTAYRIQRELENVEHVVYEKNGDIGGAWLENRYPNCGCDVPSHSYVYSFALNPEWPELYSQSESIWAYLDRICRVFDLRKLMRFNHRISDAIWDEAAGLWRLTIEKTYIDGSVEVLHDSAASITMTCCLDVLLQATGLQNNPIIPNIEGIHEFKGRIIHTAQWPSDFKEPQWKGLKVAVLGAGSSAVQTVPGLQPHVDKLHCFIRNRTWLVSIFPEPEITTWSEAQRQHFRDHPDDLVKQARKGDCAFNGLWSHMFTASPGRQQSITMATEKTTSILNNSHLASKIIPSFSYGCRRVTPGNNFLKAIGKPNVTCHFTAASRITRDSVIGKDGTEAKCDVIVMATGFDTSYRPHYNLVGQDGVSLSEKWKHVPEGYLGIGCPGFPNYITFYGPAWPVSAGAITACLAAAATHAIKVIRKIQSDDIRSMAPKQSVTDAFNDHQQTMLHGTVWEDRCSSWFKDKNGRINAIWPGSGLHFQEVVSDPRWEDYDIQYKNPYNMWAFLGRGFTQRERSPGSDMAPYLSVEALDMKWFDSSVPWVPAKVPDKESARLATAEQPPEHLKSTITLDALDVTGRGGGRTGTLAGATLVEVDEFGKDFTSE